MPRPFKHLRELMRRNALTLTNRPAPPPVASAGDGRPANPRTERQLFLAAMEGVTPLARGKRRHRRPSRASVQSPDQPNEATEALKRLEKLVTHGEGFVVAHTPEYIEGAEPQTDPRLTRRLHAGHFSVQAHIDLHGMTVAEAQEAFNRFIGQATLTGKRTVLVVHGRGLSSPQKPVLKTKVREWLSSGAWRKWVLAYASARPCDGGTGATYVLLRHRPLARRFRKRPKTEK
jgi:DNA-nicking Smr family endonuclease